MKCHKIGSQSEKIELNVILVLLNDTGTLLFAAEDFDVVYFRQFKHT